MQTIDTPQTPEYWKTFYLVQAILIADLKDSHSTHRLNNLAHAIATKVYNEKI